MRSRSSIRAQAGFSILELMVVIVLIGIMATMMAPAVTDALADRNTNQAAIDMVRLVRRARAETIGYGRAHVLSFVNDSGVGTALLFRGVTTNCNQNNWDAILAADCSSAMCVDSVDMAADEYEIGDNTVSLTSNFGDSGQLCFQPNGATLWRAAAGSRFSETLPAGEAIQFSLQRAFDDELVGVARTIVLPPGGDPRIMR